MGFSGFGEEYIPVVVEGQEVVRSIVMDQEEDKKGHMINSSLWQTDADVSAAVLQGHKEHVALRGDAQPNIVDAPTDVAGVETSDNTNVPSLSGSGSIEAV